MGDGGEGMNLDEDLRTTLVTESERREPPLVDLAGMMTRGRARRRRGTVLRVGMVAAVVALTGGVAFALAQGDRAAPEPVAPPTPDATPLLTGCAADGCVEPGSYRVRLGADEDAFPVRATLTVEADRWGPYGAEPTTNRISQPGTTGAVVFTVYEPTALAGPRPCDAEDTRELAPGASVDEVARRLARLPQFDVVGGTTQVPAFGHETLHLQVRADRIRCTEQQGGDKEGLAQYNVADIVKAQVPGAWEDSDIYPGQPVLIDFWVLDVGGHNIVVESRQEGSPTKQMIEQLDQVRGSLTFVSQE